MNEIDNPIPPMGPSSPASTGGPREGNGQAIASMVLGILSFVLCGPFLAVPAIILGHISLDKIRNGLLSGDARGFAMAGLVLGYINLAIFVVIVVPLILLVIFSHGAAPVASFIQKM